MYIHLVWIKDSKSETLNLGLVLVENNFHDVFPEDLVVVSLERETNFEIDLLPDVQLISTPPYKMAPVKLKELNE